MKTEDKAKIFHKGLEQGISLQKEKQLERIRKVLYMLVFNLEEEEIEILYKALKNVYEEKVTQ